MKIKFIKEYKFLRGFENDIKLSTAKILKDAIIDTVEDEVPDEDVQWLINNGFAKEVENKSFCSSFTHGYDDFDSPYVQVGFYTYNRRNANLERDRFTEFLQAVNAVSQDEGFMRKNGGGFGWPVIEFTTNNPGVDDIAGRQHAGEFYFDTREHALNSAMNHTREWQTILNYDWSRE